MANSSFEIVNGVLKKYSGTDKEVIIPEGVVGIDRNCFVDAHFMESIKLPSTLRKIGYSIVATDYAGYEYALKRVYVDSLDTWMNIEFADDKANLLGVSKDIEFYINGELVTDLVIPGKYKVVKTNCFYGYKKLKSVVFEEGVEIIEKSAFARSGIEKAVLPNSVKDLVGKSYGAFFSSPFQQCKNLKEINIPEGIKVLPDYFLDCSAIEEIKLPEGLEVIPSGCFNSCKNLKSINIPSSVHTVGDAFCRCDSLEELIFPDSVHTIGSITLDNVKKIILPEDWSFTGNKYWSILKDSKIEHLETNEYDNALYIGSRTNPYQVLVRAKNKDIESCVIHKDCKCVCGSSDYSIGKLGFRECKNLKSLSLPKGIKRIETGALSKCDSLESIDLSPTFGVLDPSVYEGSPKLKFKEYGIKDRVFLFEKNAELDDDNVKEVFSISSNGISLTSTKTLASGEVIKTNFKKKNKVSSERLIAIFTKLLYAEEMNEQDYLNDLDVYKVTFPVNDKETATKYVYFDEAMIETIYSLFKKFVGDYFLINAFYKDSLVNHFFRPEVVREEIEKEYQGYSLEQLGELLIKAKDSGSFIKYEKINLYMSKLKNNGEWNQNYGEE